jgi:outer membrane receptor for ferrienterochelin and colicin
VFADLFATPLEPLLLHTSLRYDEPYDFDNENFRNVNRKHVQTSGIELQTEWRLLAALRLRSQATYTDIDVKNADTVLTGRPQWTAQRGRPVADRRAE